MQYWGISLPPFLFLIILTQDYKNSPSPSPLGYKFETLSTLPKIWAETSREYIENRENQIVNNKEQYCSVVRTGIGKTVLCLGGEVDASMFSPP